MASYLAHPQSPLNGPSSPPFPSPATTLADEGQYMSALPSDQHHSWYNPQYPAAGSPATPSSVAISGQAYHYGCEDRSQQIRPSEAATQYQMEHRPMGIQKFDVDDGGDGSESKCCSCAIM